MANWIKYVFLNRCGRGARSAPFALVLALLAGLPPGLLPAVALAEAGDNSKPAAVQVIMPEVKTREVKEADIDEEFFEIGVYAGILNIENFGSEPLVGISAAFHATEDFFLQFNYGVAEAGLTSFEELSGQNVRLLTSDEREYRYYDLLLGYNIFPGEVFLTSKLTFNSAFYLVAGVGNTEFGGEDNFTTTFGTGYRIVLRDWLTWHIDIRDHMFKSDIIKESQLTHNIELSSGITLFF